MQDKDNKGDRQRQGGTLCGGPWETIISAVVGPGGGPCFPPRTFRGERFGGDQLLYDRGSQIHYDTGPVFAGKSGPGPVFD